MEMQTIKPVPIIVTKWKQGPKIGPSFNDCESSFFFGNPHTGKSNQLIAILTQFLANGHRVMDIAGSRTDAEELVHFRSTYKDRVVMIVGPDMEVKSNFASHVMDSSFKLEDLKEYDVVTTTRRLYPSEDAYYYALARIFKLCTERQGWKEHDGGRIIALGIREAWNIIRSVMRAGMARDEQDAQYGFIDMNNQRFHSGVAPNLDTQDYMAVHSSVRKLTNFKYNKGFGGQPIPDELDFMFKPHLFGEYKVFPNGMKVRKGPHEDGPWRMRNLPPDEFIMMTSWNGVAKGIVGLVPWAINKGEDLMEKLDIDVTSKKGEPEPERGDKHNGSTHDQDLHDRIRNLKEQGMGPTAIMVQLRTEGTKATMNQVRSHLYGWCQGGRE